MTEAEWLDPDSPLVADWRTAREAPLTRRAATLFGVACVRATPGVEGQRRLLDAVAAAEEAADTGRWEEVGRVNLRAGAACGKVRVGSDAHLWALAASNLTSEWVGNSWANVPTRLLGVAAPRRDARGLRRTYGDLMRDVVGNPFRGGRLGLVGRPADAVLWDDEPPGSLLPAGWLTDTVLSLADAMYDGRDFAAMPILADALQDAGCEDEQVLTHCRGPGPHVRGCWVVDLVLGKG
jgi:hypothetical protein